MNNPKTYPNIQIRILSPMEHQSNPLAIYTYSIAHLTHCEKIKFYYSLKGRDNKKGMLQTTGTEQLGKGVLLVPQSHWENVSTFLQDWQCNFKKRVVFAPKEDVQ